MPAIRWPMASAARSISPRTTAIVRWPTSTGPSSLARSAPHPTARGYDLQEQGRHRQGVGRSRPGDPARSAPGGRFFERAALRKAKGETDLVLADLNEGLSREPANRVGLLARAQIRQSKAKPPAPSPITMRCSRANLITPARCALAPWRDGNQELRQGVADFDRVIRLEPRNAQAYYQRGLRASRSHSATAPLPITSWRWPRQKHERGAQALARVSVEETPARSRASRARSKARNGQKDRAICQRARSAGAGQRRSGKAKQAAQTPPAAPAEERKAGKPADKKNADKKSARATTEDTKTPTRLSRPRLFRATAPSGEKAERVDHKREKAERPTVSARKRRDAQRTGKNRASCGKSVRRRYATTSRATSGPVR